MPPPAQPKLYHICHVDRLASIVADDHLWCDAEIVSRAPEGTTIGMGRIKRRRLEELTLTSHPDLHVGECVPFYFAPRSVMLYLIHKRNSELTYSGGQGPIVHLLFDLGRVAAWAEAQGLRWAFTLSNAGSFYFEDRGDLGEIDEIDWAAVRARDWQGRQEKKQAEFLVEHRVPWSLVEGVAVHSETTQVQAAHTMTGAGHRPPIKVKPTWYY